MYKNYKDRGMRKLSIILIIALISVSAFSDSWTRKLHLLDKSTNETSVALGTTVGATRIRIFAYDDNVLTTEETMWTEAGSYVWPTAAAQLTVSSSDANDTSAGTGATIAVVAGLDADFVEIEENIVLDGQSGVTTTNSYFRINDFYVISAGTTGSNEGKLYVGTGTITAGVPATVYSVINIGTNKHEQCIYTIPDDGSIAIVPTGYASASSNKNVTISVYVRPFGAVFQKAFGVLLFQSSFTFNLVYPDFIPAKSDIEFRAKADAAGAETYSGMEIVIFDELTV